MTDRQPESQVENTEYEAPQITDYGTLAEFTAGMTHLSHVFDATFQNNDGPPVSVPS
jgi:hypothetical protein